MALGPCPGNWMVVFPSLHGKHAPVSNRCGAVGNMQLRTAFDVDLSTYDQVNRVIRHTSLFTRPPSEMMAPMVVPFRIRHAVENTQKW